MSKYTNKPNQVNANSLHKNRFSLSPQSYREVLIPSVNYKYLKELINLKTKGFEPGSSDYIEFGNNYFIRISEMNNDEYTFSLSKQTKKLVPQKKDIKISKGDLCYQTASNVGNVCFYEGEDAYFNSHILKLDVNEDFKYYLFAILKSSYNKEQVDIGGSIKGVDNFSEKDLYETIIPFPEDKIQSLVSILVKNIIDKEQQLKVKRNEIDKLVNKELNISQTATTLPSAAEIISNSFRFDSGMYSRKFKTIKTSIENYEHGYVNIPIEKFTSGNTPKVRLFNKGIQKYKWATPTNIKDEGFFNDVDTISMPTVNNLNKDAIMFINRTSKGGEGEYVGICAFYDYSYYGKGHHNQGIYRVEDYEKEDLLFIAAFMNTTIMRTLCSKISYGSKMKEMKLIDFSQLIFPNFPENKKNEVVTNYYCEVNASEDVTIDTYLGKEFKRNTNLGIFQLNAEINALRKQVEELIDKIIHNEDIMIHDYLSVG